MSADAPIRCPKKKDCVIAWPESCPAWDRWDCPVDLDKGQVPAAVRSSSAAPDTEERSNR